MSTIHLVVDLGRDELLRVAALLKAMAACATTSEGFAKNAKGAAAPDLTQGTEGAVVIDEEEPGPDAATAFGTGPDDEASTAIVEDPKPGATSPPVVELDSEFLPWDERIHGKNRDKLAKTQAWKKRRCPKEMNAEGWAAYIVEVEAELRAVMAIGTTAKTETASPSKPAGPAGPADDSATLSADATNDDAGTEMNFADFLAVTTANKIDKATVDAAVKKTGLPGLPLLATRPDLIPAVMAELFPGL